MITIDWRDLGLTDKDKPFAQGAVGELFRVPQPVPNVPGRLVAGRVVPRKLVFKRVVAQQQLQAAGVDRKQVLEQMRKVVALRDAMSPDDLNELDEVTAWPLAMVRKEGKDVGILLDLIDDEFWVDAKPPGGPPDRVLFELQFLCVSDGYFQRLGIDASPIKNDAMRLALAARLAYAIEVIHRHSLVFGDLHLKNVVAAFRPQARVLLMDCDGVAHLNDTSRVQLHGPFFTPPEIAHQQQRLQDQKTDVYKLGMCIIRMLSPGFGATQVRSPSKAKAGLLDAEGVRLLERAVSENRDERPEAWELREYLVRRLKSLIRPPILRSAELSHRAVLRGSNLFVRWDQEGGTEVRIFGANGWTVTGIDPERYKDGYAIKPPHAGPIDVEIWNDDGPSQRVRAGYFDYYELPALDMKGAFADVLRLHLPDLPTLDASVFDRLEPYPEPVYPDLNISLSAPEIRFPPLTLGLGQGPLGTGLDNVPQSLLHRLSRQANGIVSKAIARARLQQAIRKELDRIPDYVFEAIGKEGNESDAGSPRA
jgi:serine/threonine protein kinase